MHSSIQELSSRRSTACAGAPRHHADPSHTRRPVMAPVMAMVCPSHRSLSQAAASTSCLSYGNRPSQPGAPRNRCRQPERAKAAAGGGSLGGRPMDSQGLLNDMLAYAYAMQMQQAEAARAQAGAAGPTGARVTIRDLHFHPPGAEQPLLNHLNMDVEPNSLGLIIGRSGSGKTTLLQVLAGLCEQTSGRVIIGPGTSPKPPPAPAPGSTNGGSSTPKGSSAISGSTLEERMARVGLVFQFPERHFLGGDVFGELTFTWPRDPNFFLQQQELRARVMRVLQAVQLDKVDMALPPWALSGGQQRRLALAIQLVRQPSLMLLDEPLAGLDWKARAEVVELLGRLKKECTLLVVSHDVREIAPLVDHAWTMKLGGTMEVKAWPPEGGLDALVSTAGRE